MTARTHDLAAFTSLIAAAAYFPPASINLPTLFASIIVCDIGSLFPDMDQAGNRLWDLFPVGDVVGRIFRNAFIGHRTISHSLLGIYLIYIGLGWLLERILNPGLFDIQLVRMAFMVGVVSHLVSDSLTEEGIPLFFPLKAKIGFPPIKPWRIKTGGWFEKLVIYPALLVSMFLLVLNHREGLVHLLRGVN